MGRVGTPPLLDIPASATPQAVQAIHIQNFNISRDWEETLSRQMQPDNAGNREIPYDPVRLARAASRVIQLGGLIEHPDIPPVSNQAALNAIQLLTDRVDALQNQVDEMLLDNRRRDIFYAQTANGDRPLQGPFLIVPSPEPPHLLPMAHNLPALTNGDVIQQLSNDQANLYLNFYQVPIQIGPPADLPHKRKAIGRAIGLHETIIASL